MGDQSSWPHSGTVVVEHQGQRDGDQHQHRTPGSHNVIPVGWDGLRTRHRVHCGAPVPGRRVPPGGETQKSVARREHAD